MKKLIKLKKIQSGYSLLIFSLLLLQFLSNGSNLTPTIAKNISSPSSSSSSLSLTDYDGDYSLHITSDVELAAASSGGIGTQGDPYIIEGLELVSAESYGIKIELTTRHFIVRDNIITSHFEASNISFVNFGKEPAQEIMSGSGIIIESVAAGTATIFNNIISYFGEAISIRGSQNTTIEENECFNNEVGTSLSSSEFSIVTSNSYSNNDRYAVYCASDRVNITNNFFTGNDLSIFTTGNYLLLENNTLINNSEGIILYLSSETVVNNNTLIDNTIGINAFYSEKLTLLNNTMINCGLSITLDHEEYSSSIEAIDALNEYIVGNNTVNSLPLGFLINLENTTIGINYGQLFLINSTRVTVEDQNCSFASVGIALYYGSSSILRSNNCSYNNVGFYIFHSSNTTLEGNRGNYSQEEGIKIISSDNSTINTNLCADSDLGIAISATANAELINNTVNGIALSACVNTTIVNNILTKNGLSFEQSSVIDLLSNTVINNTINDNPVGYIVNTHDETIDSTYGQLIIINCSRLEISEVNCSMTSNGISFFFSSFCEVTDSIFSLNKNGIYSLGTNNLSIHDNQLFNNSLDGIHLVNSPNATIVQNNCSYSLNGIKVINSEYTEVSENYCYENGNEQKIEDLLLPSEEIGAGITLVNSTNSQVKDNQVLSNQIGIIVRSSYSVLIESNTLEDGIYGIYLSYSYHSQVINNNLLGCVLLVVDSSPENYRSYDIENNTVNGLELGFFVDIADITIDESNYGQLLLIYCRRVAVKNQEIDSPIGIRLIECADCEIIANVCNYNLIGIVTERSTNVKILDNYCFNNTFAGIYTLNSEDLIISENGCVMINLSLEYTLPSSILLVKTNDTEISQNECYGAYGLSITQSHDVEITDNRFSYNTVGILLYQSVSSYQTEENPWGRWYSYGYSSSNNCTITNNILSNNDYGIYAEHTRFTLIAENILTNNIVGIILDYSLGTEIVYNQITDSYYKGIFFYHSQGATVQTNLIANIDGYGVYVEVSSGDNQFTANLFINNTINAWDNGQSNRWYDQVALSGNYWDDFLAGQYDIPGEAGVIDLYPITTIDLTDYDGDAIPNDCEQANGLNPLLDDSSLDLDNDGLTNLQEFNRGTDPNNADTDGDGFSDGDEVDFGSDPLDASSNKEATYDYYREIVLIVISSIVGLPLLFYYIKEYLRIRKVAAEQSTKLPLIIQQVSDWNYEIVDMDKKLEIITTEVELVGFLSRSNEIMPEMKEVQHYISCIQKAWLLKLRLRKSFKELTSLMNELKANYEVLLEKLIMSTKMQEIIKV